MADLDKMFSKIKRVFKETIKAVALALCLVALLKGSIVEANQIISSSMTPTLLEGDFIIVNKLKYGLHLPFIDKMLLTWSQPERGDVVTFIPPEISPGEKGKIFVKRIIAIPGDMVEIKNSQLYINNRPVKTDKSAINGNVFRELMDGKQYNVVKFNDRYSFGPVKVPSGYVFAVGDNRDNSHDSRDWGPLPIENIEGKAVVIYFSKAVSKGFENLKRIGNLL